MSIQYFPSDRLPDDLAADDLILFAIQELGAVVVVLLPNTPPLLEISTDMSVAEGEVQL